MDTRHLRLRGGSWQLDFTLSDRLDIGARGRQRIALSTADLKAARGIRDRCLAPLLASSSAVDFLATLADTIARTNETARKHLNELLAKTGLGIRAGAGDTLTLDALGKLYLDHLQKVKQPAGTVRKYAATIAAAVEVLGSEKPAATIAAADMIVLRDALLQKSVGVGTLKPSYVNRELARLKSIFRWAIDEERLAMSGVPGAKVRCENAEGDTHKERPTREHADKLVALPFPARQRQVGAEEWRYMPLIARYTGLRISEVATLEADDVVERSGVRCIHVHRALKTEGSRRHVPVSDRLAPHLDAVVKLHPKGPLFPRVGSWESADGWKKVAHHFLKMWNEAAKGVGPYSFHCWRVYANSEMADAGVDMVDRERSLGHKSDRTQEAYTPADMARFKKAVDSIL